MNRLLFYWNRLCGKPSVARFTLLGQELTLGIRASREIKRVHDIGIEKELIERLRQVVRPDDVVYDIGANIGLITILTATHEQSQGCRVLSFEPEPTNFEQLKNNIRLNELEGNVMAYQVALGDKPGSAILHVRGTAGEGRHSIASDKGATGTIEVALDTVSEFVSRTGEAPHVVKIDVEGAEGQVLEGMGTLMKGQSPREIFLEIHPKGNRDTMPSGGVIHDWLTDRGYTLAWKNRRGSGEHRHYQRVLA